MLRRVHVALSVLLACTALGGCGEPDVGGSGRLERVEGGGAGDHLILEGTPYEMGWWHGHLLKDRIRALHEEWQREAFALDGDLMSADTQARRKAALALVEPVLQNHLPEAVRQEYQGLSDACGLPVRTLLLTEMITDILRFTEKEPRLLTGRIARGTEREGVALAVGGPWEGLLAPQWLWIRRKGGGGTKTVLTWPGGLGGVLAVLHDDPVVAVATERAMDRGREGLAGVPFRISLRLSAAAHLGRFLEQLSRTTGHDVLAVKLPGGPGIQRLVASTPDDAVPVPPADAPDASGGLQPSSAAWRSVTSAASSLFWVEVERGAARLAWSIREGGQDRFQGWIRAN
jgi:hypothetical protein